MAVSRTLADMDAIKSLALVLSTCAEVNRYDQGSERESWTLALAFGDIEESFFKIYNELVPKLLTEALNSDEVKNLLLALARSYVMCSITSVIHNTSNTLGRIPKRR